MLFDFRNLILKYIKNYKKLKDCWGVVVEEWPFEFTSSFKKVNSPFEFLGRVKMEKDCIF